MLNFGRDICHNLHASEGREWLVTNGIGGFACGTIPGVLTRRYHGLLVAALEPPLGRTLLVTKTDDTITYNAQSYTLFTNRWASGVVEPSGFHYLRRFHLEGTTPVWTYACGDALLEKRVWMEHGANTTYVRYNLLQASSSLILTTKLLVNYRDYHGTTSADDLNIQVDEVDHGLRVMAGEGTTPFYLLGVGAKVIPQSNWYLNFYLNVEAYRGLDAVEDHYQAGSFAIILQPEESFTLVFSTEPNPNLDSETAYAAKQVYEAALIKAGRQVLTPASQTETNSNFPNTIQHLLLAADQFIVKRPSPADAEGHTIIAGYPWFSDWGRDTMISLPGLTLSTGRPEIARSILQTFAQFVDQGMLPNRFPDAGERPEYNTVDATLWYFEALRAYYKVTGDKTLLEELFPILQEIITWHQRGTRYNIQVDAADGLLYAGAAGKQLTWMDVKIRDWVVTPRIGKPVEINALWHNALLIMAEIAQVLGHSATPYQTAAQKTAAGFSRFWNQSTGYCYDVLDGPDGHAPDLRPNQLFAVSLPHSPLPSAQQKGVVDACARDLLTPYGLRSLSHRHPDYQGHYGGNQRDRDSVYHQGIVWAWLIGPFVRAYLRVYDDSTSLQSFFQPLLQHLYQHGLGTISEIFDGNPPFTPRGCIAQAWSVAEFLRLWQESHTNN